MSDNGTRLIGLAEAARRLGDTGRGGRGVYSATLTRWIQTDVRAGDGTRVKLRAVRIGSKWATCQDWLDAFIERITATHVAPDNAPALRTPAERERGVAAANATLALLGV